MKCGGRWATMKGEGSVICRNLYLSAISDPEGNKDDFAWSGQLSLFITPRKIFPSPPLSMQNTLRSDRTQAQHNVIFRTWGHLAGEKPSGHATHDNGTTDRRPRSVRGFYAPWNVGGGVATTY